MRTTIRLLQIISIAVLFFGNIIFLQSQEVGQDAKIDRNLLKGIRKHLDTTKTLKKENKNWWETSSLQFDNQQRIKVDIIISSDSGDLTEVLNLISRGNGNIEKIHQYGNVLHYICWLKPEKVIDAANLKAVARIREVIAKPYRTRTVTSAGDTQLVAKKVRTQLGAYGDSIKIGVISDGVDNLTQVRGAGELPFVDVITSGDGNEGTAMLEIVHDLAPNAPLYFAAGGSSTFDFASAIQSLTGEGCKVIVDDLGWVFEPYFSDEDHPFVHGNMGSKIKDFIAGGNVYVSSAGNETETIYSGSTSCNSSGINIFPGGNDYLEATIDGNDSLWLCFQWATRWTLPTNDFDLYVYSESEQPIDTSNWTQTTQIPPEESMYLINTSSSSQKIRIRVRTKNGTVINNVEYKIAIWSSNREPATKFSITVSSNHIFGHSAYPNVVSVAAYSADDTTKVANYSSRGPAKMYSTLANDWTTQNVPTVTGTAKVQTYIGQQGLFGNPFEGTSAAAPHIAAVAALYFDALPGKTNTDFITDLKNSAATIGTNTGGTWHEETGWGRANALAAIQLGMNTVATPQFNPASTTFTGTLQVTISTTTSGAKIKYTTNGNDPQPGDPEYTSPVSLNLTATTTVKAQAVKSGMNPSIVNSASYVLTTGGVPASHLYQIDENNVIFGTTDWWWSGGNQWQQVEPTVNMNDWIEYWVVRASQSFKPATAQKFWKWTKTGSHVSYLNHSGVGGITRSGGNIVEGHFKSSSGGFTIQNKVEDALVVGDSVGFQDPWLVDYNESPYGMRNRGMGALFISKPSPFLIDGNGVSNSIFKDQLIISGTYYSVRAKNNITWNGSPAYFQGWNYDPAKVELQQVGSNPAGYDQKAVVFKSTPATVSANYKGHFVSNTATTFTNNSQRKVVKTYDGNLHIVYESIGGVWYEKTNSTGVSLQILNISLNGKSPSIAILDADAVAIVWHENRTSTGMSRIKGKIINFTSGLLEDDDIIANVEQPYSTANLDPVISVAPMINRLAVAWREPNKGDGLNPGGIYTMRGKKQDRNANEPRHFEWRSTYNPSVPLSGTNGNSVSPAMDCSPYVDGSVVAAFHLAWEQKVPGHLSDLMYCPFTQSYDDPFSFGTPKNVSIYGGYSINTKPSIIGLGTSASPAARIYWIGEYDDGQSASVFVDPGPDPEDYFYYNFGYGVGSVSLNKSYSTPLGSQVVPLVNGYVLGWSEYGSAQYYTDVDAMESSIFDQLTSVGNDIQIINSTTRTSMRALALNNISPQVAPYPLNISNTTVRLEKSASKNIANGRVGRIIKDNTQIYFCLGDVTVDNEIIRFTDIPDTISMKDQVLVKKLLSTKPFVLTDKSIFSFGVQYGTTDSAQAVNMLKDNKYVSFKIDLIDDKSGKVIGSFDDWSFGQNNIIKSGNMEFQIGTEGIGKKTVRLQLIPINNLDGYTSVSSRVSVSSVTRFKKNGNTIKKVGYNGREVVIDYALEQNYPNPFNPTTTISYALPKDGIVTLRIYDALGREVKTLVDEFKQTGRYTAEFDASKLASGVYIYELVSEEYAAVKKMLLVK